MLGFFLMEGGEQERAEGITQSRQALDIQTKLAAEFPTVPAYRRQLASSHNNRPSYTSRRP